MKVMLAVLILTGLVLPLQAAQLEATLSPQNARVGDELWLELKVSGAPPSAIRFPAPDQADFTLLRMDTSRLAAESVLRYALAIYDTGRFVLSELPVVVNSGASAETLYTPQLGVTIGSVLPDTASAPLPIKPYREHPFRWKDLIRQVVRSPWTWMVVALLFVLAGVWLWRRYFRKAKAGEMAASVVLLPPHDQAVRDLIALKDKKYPARGMMKEFFSEFSQIMRNYLERRYEFPALEMTTFDLESTLREDAFPPVIKQKLLPTLHEADLVKFAKYVPPLERCDVLLETGFEIVAATKPAELPETERKAA